MILVALMVPVLVFIGYLDVRAWIAQNHHSPAPAAATPTEHTTVVPPVVRPTRSPTPTRTVPRATDNAPAVAAQTTPATTTTPSPTFTAGASCAGHREGLREYDPAGRLVVCASGTWTYLQPAGAPVSSTPSATVAPPVRSAAPTTDTPTTTAPTSTDAPTPATTSSSTPDAVTTGASPVTSG